MVSWLNNELPFENVCKGVSKCAYPAIHTAMGFELTTPLPFFDYGHGVSEREQKKSRFKKVLSSCSFFKRQSLAVKERSCFVLS